MLAGKFISTEEKLFARHRGAQASGCPLQTFNVEHAGDAAHRTNNFVEMLHVKNFNRHLDAPAFV